MQIGHFFPRTRKLFLRDLVISTDILLAAIICCFVINQSSAESAESGHVPLIFVLAVSLIISAATTQIKQQDAIRAKAEQEALRANLLRAVSHDIRTPLTSIVGTSSALMEHGDQLTEEDCHRLLCNINEDANWLVRVVENLLFITRISGQAKISKEHWGPNAKCSNQILRVNMANIRRKIEKNPAEPTYIFTKVGVGYRMVESD